ncbi:MULTISPECIES: TVP38/TMEM64 family protein [Oceanobacillus]|uniref:TVP38/TMEM64 family membrane protein n=1 Tax=Oceanobacillus profundus TaxID=372463 RepID=A0A417YLN4_9BACI|nr:TVP38/TMEM64 family protein [Oceanobacillus profundus]MBR3119125.1 TVP38/TMEM64 family protein [Oceanobacillus sp.]MCM3399251.1 TVP38/TMEM64 family protein [Oceanobacillus profundus]PAE29508.1 TVP38/TMEM64 family protein [Paenibacillus sp. 7884-2]RHW34407.1 TVP38/TMEM64 family protein [Oceanobacillus profundus]
MYLSNITFSNWKNVLETEGLENFIEQLLEQYEGLGPLPGIILPFIEAFLPFLPLIVFVLGNAAAYGLLEGFLFSWIGASSGAIVVFVVIRRLGNTKLFVKIRKNNQVKRITAWVERHGFGPLFLLLCFPFSPSAIINVVAGLSKVSTHQFILAVFLGKAVMIFSISYVGSSIMEFAKNPVRTIVVGIGIFLFWMLGKYLEQKLQKKAMDKARQDRKKD